METEKLITKVTQIVQCDDGSEVRLVAEAMSGLGLHQSVDVRVHRRESPDVAWQFLCSMPAEQYGKDADAELLKVAPRSAILKLAGMIGEPMETPEIESLKVSAGKMLEALEVGLGVVTWAIDTHGPNTFKLIYDGCREKISVYQRAMLVDASENKIKIEADSVREALVAVKVVIDWAMRHGADRATGQSAYNACAHAISNYDVAVQRWLEWTGALAMRPRDDLPAGQQVSGRSSMRG